MLQHQLGHQSTKVVWERHAHATWAWRTAGRHGGRRRCRRRRLCRQPRGRLCDQLLQQVQLRHGRLRVHAGRASQPRCSAALTCCKASKGTLPAAR